MQYLQLPERGGREPGPGSERWSVLRMRGTIPLVGHDRTDGVPEVRKSLSTAFCGGQHPCWALLKKKLNK